ncbi:stage III sporulation protein AA [Zongyangia hominis]|uniref:Stage III sporulation protein AA n=1 Tax=Zongyangia hominis TaxID=2763677 RepID=A0A926IAZ4_9FIRM|nr:stage III sporulation protein AA [Zongyangia hominis]MBC8569610.1 stage III sporulation protein AA [Zongyangia hominis]
MAFLPTDKKFDQAAAVLPARIRALLLALPPQEKRQIREIRIRAGLPIHLCTGKGHFFLAASGLLTGQPSDDALVVDRPLLTECFRTVCGYSVHAHQEDLRRGFITLPGGHRVGICGTCVCEAGEIAGVRDISSLNIRVAREVTGAAGPLVQALGGRVGGTLLAGVPGCGKTTVLRDLARQLGDGSLGQIFKTTVIDERGELAAMSGGVPQNNLGYCCDVLSGYPKGDAILQAIRTLSPDYILCDEIGDERDAAGLMASVYAGVTMIATVHAGSMEELFSRTAIRPLVDSGAFSTLCFLGDASQPGRVHSIYQAGEKDAENLRNDLYDRRWRLCWTQGLPVPDPAGRSA